MIIYLIQNHSMPARNTIKQYQVDGYYHVYNRGVEKRDIFLCDQDYQVFLDRLRRYLDPNYQSPKKDRSRHLSLYGRAELISYCLMPNHFHLLLHQASKSGMEELMRRVMTSYSMYFNLKYGRVGSLFQGRYKAALVTGDDYLIHLSRYIHLNPCQQPDYRMHAYTSLPFYLGEPAPAWLNPQPILQHFNAQSTYAQFMNAFNETPTFLTTLTLDS